PARLFLAVFAQDTQLGAGGNLARGGGVLGDLLGGCSRGERELRGAISVAQNRTETPVHVLYELRRDSIASGGNELQGGCIVLFLRIRLNHLLVEDRRRNHAFQFVTLDIIQHGLRVEDAVSDNRVTCAQS